MVMVGRVNVNTVSGIVFEVVYENDLSLPNKYTHEGMLTVFTKFFETHWRYDLELFNRFLVNKGIVNFKVLEFTKEGGERVACF